MTSPRRILVLAEQNDIHAIALQGTAERSGVAVDIVDLKHVPRDYQLVVTPSAGLVMSDQGTELRLGEYTGVWWRRPRSPASPATLSGSREMVQQFASEQFRTVLNGSFYAYRGNIINDPGCELRAGNKVYQLSVAARLGAKIPDTCVTSDPHAAERFLATHRSGVIFKPLTAPSFQFAPTRVLDETMVKNLDQLRHCPAILQERVNGTWHLRVTVVDDRIFAARLRGREGQLDWRVEGRLTIDPYTLDIKTSDNLRLLMRTLGLRYGAADYVLGMDGEPVFLELNPAGQYLFVELETEYQITEALVESLLAATP